MIGLKKEIHYDFTEQNYEEKIPETFRIRSQK